MKVLHGLDVGSRRQKDQRRPTEMAQSLGLLRRSVGGPDRSLSGAGSGG
jgi:hypothetical protein